MTLAELLGWIVAVFTLTACAWWHRRAVASQKARVKYYKSQIKVLENYMGVMEASNRRHREHVDKLLDQLYDASLKSSLSEIRTSATASSTVSPRYEREVLP